MKQVRRRSTPLSIIVLNLWASPLHVRSPGKQAASVPWCDNPSDDVEWLILLHKFYYAVGLGQAFVQSGDSRYRDCWMRLTHSWIDQVPLEFLSSDVMGRRVQNWIYAHWYFIGQSGQTPACSDTLEGEAAFYAKLLLSIHQQIEYLTQHLTPARNHRTIELTAIFLTAIVFPEFRRAAEWLAFATDELAANIQQDFHADGVHIEQSTDYHHLVLKNYLNVKRLAYLNGYALPCAIHYGIQQAAEFSAFAHKPDGFVPSFSDGDSRSFLSLWQWPATFTITRSGPDRHAGQARSTATRTIQGVRTRWLLRVAKWLGAMRTVCRRVVFDAGLRATGGQPWSF